MLKEGAVHFRNISAATAVDRPSLKDICERLDDCMAQIRALNILQAGPSKELPPEQAAAELKAFALHAMAGYTKFRSEVEQNFGFIKNYAQLAEDCRAEVIASVGNNLVDNAETLATLPGVSALSHVARKLSLNIDPIPAERENVAGAVPNVSTTPPVGFDRDDTSGAEEHRAAGNPVKCAEAACCRGQAEMIRHSEPITGYLEKTFPRAPVKSEKTLVEIIQTAGNLGSSTMSPGCRLGLKHKFRKLCDRFVFEYESENPSPPNPLREQLENYSRMIGRLGEIASTPLLSEDYPAHITQHVRVESEVSNLSAEVVHDGSAIIVKIGLKKS